MANVTIAFQANGGSVDYTPRLMSDPQGTRTVKDGSKQDLDGKKNGQVRLSLPTNKDFVVADAKKHWIVTKGKVSAGKPNVIPLTGPSITFADHRALNLVGKRLVQTGNDDAEAIKVLQDFLDQPKWQGLLAKRHGGWMPSLLRRLSANNFVRKTWSQLGGKPLKTVIRSIVDQAAAKRTTAMTELTNALNRLHGNTNSLLNPSFLSSDLQQLVRGANEYGQKLVDNSDDIKRQLDTIVRTMDFLTSTSKNFLAENAWLKKDLENLGTRLADFTTSAAGTLRNIRGDFKRIKSAKDRERTLNIVSSVMAGLAVAGSVGFAVSNFTATALQKLTPTLSLEAGKVATPAQLNAAKANWKSLTLGARVKNVMGATNLGASFGSTTLGLGNLAATALFSYRAETGKTLASMVGGPEKIVTAIGNMSEELGRFTMFFANVNKLQGKSSERVLKQSGWHRSHPDYPLDDKMIVKGDRVGFYSFKQRGGMMHGDGKWTEWYFNSWPKSHFGMK